MQIPDGVLLAAGAPVLGAASIAGYRTFVNIFRKGAQAKWAEAVNEVTSPQFAKIETILTELGERQLALHHDNKTDHGRVVERIAALEKRVGELEKLITTKETGTDEADHPPTPR